MTTRHIRQNCWSQSLYNTMEDNCCYRCRLLMVLLRTVVHGGHAGSGKALAKQDLGQSPQESSLCELPGISALSFVQLSLSWCLGTCFYVNWPVFTFWTAWVKTARWSSDLNVTNSQEPAGKRKLQCPFPENSIPPLRCFSRIEVFT